MHNIYKKLFAIFLLSSIILIISCQLGSDGQGIDPSQTYPTTYPPLKTGQTTSYAARDDGALQMGRAWASPRFTNDSVNLVIIDNSTGLMWERNISGVTDSWTNMLTYCDTLVLGIYSDFRMPNSIEFYSLFNYSNANQNAWLSSQGFVAVASNFFWSSNTNFTTTSEAFIVHLDTATVNSINKTGPFKILSVRGQSNILPKTGQTTQYAANDDGNLKSGVAWPSPRFTVDTVNNTVYDNLTGLTWARVSVGTYDWSGALTYANGLTLGGKSDWRLPNLNELRSLFNMEYNNQAAWLNSQGFSSILGAQYWTSTTSAASAGDAWMINFGSTNIAPVSKIGFSYVLVVRGGM